MIAPSRAAASSDHSQFPLESLASEEFFTAEGGDEEETRFSSPHSAVNFPPQVFAFRFVTPSSHPRALAPQY
jgi:hypothetical protein